MDNDCSIPQARPHQMLIRFLRQLSDLAATAARELEMGGGAAQAQRGASLADVQLGSLQAAIVRAPGMADEDGVKPRAIAEYLERGDEPNVRMALQALAKRGVTELVPGSSPQRWRLSEAFR